MPCIPMQSLERLSPLPRTTKEFSKVAFASEAQKKKFETLVKEGKMKQETFDKHNSETATVLPKKASYKPKGQVRGVRRVR